ARKRALYSPPESYTNCRREVGPKPRCSSQQKSPASLRGWSLQLQPTFSFAGARQIRSLRAIAGAIGHAQLPRPRAHRCWLEYHADGAVGLGDQARRAGRRGDLEVAGRRDHDAVKRYALVVSKGKHF